MEDTVPCKKCKKPTRNKYDICVDCRTFKCKKCNANYLNNNALISKAELCPKCLKKQQARARKLGVD